jgi:hypothetical protein
MNSKINLKEIKKSFCFHHIKHNENEDSEDIYFCKCGKKITSENNLAKKDEITLENNLNSKSYYDNLDILSRFDEGTNVVCPKCKINYFKAQNTQIVKPSNSYFYGYFDFKIEGNRIYLNKNKIKSHCTDKSKYINLKELNSYICVDRETKKLFFKDYNSKKEVEFSLDTILKVLKYFYINNTDELSVIDNLIEVHRFLSELASIVVDSKNMDIVEGLMSQMIGKPGIDILMKINTIFFGIIVYSNLSTIALTKGTVFLYDMLSDCRLPNISTLTDNNITSPLKIFNFLVSLENEVIQKEIDSEKNENSNFVYTSKNGEKMEINLELERFGFKNKENLINISEGSINVREDIKDKTVSKYIFNKIENFYDYKKLIKFIKFISYEELINLVIKYDIEYIIQLYNKIEFRNDINSETLKQFIPLTLDYLKNSSLTVNNSKSFVSQMLGRDELEEKEVLISGESVKLNYSLLTSYSFTIYDDCSRILEELNWDKNKEFNKIKKQSELIEYHDKLVEHYNMLSDKQKYEKFKKFAEKFSFLEEYEGDLKIKLLSTPAMVLKAADEMKNCAGSYVTRISQGKYLILMLEDKSDKRAEMDSKFMLGLNLSSTTGLEFEQLKSVCNRKASDRQKTMVMKYLEEKDISYRETNDLRLGEREMRL